MAHTKFGVICSSGSGQIRRYFYPDDDSQLAAYPLTAGEIMAQVAVGPYLNTAAWQTAVNNAVQALVGKPPSDPRCCVIDSGGTVVSVIQADPAIDTIAGMTLINNMIADVGWTWSLGAGFMAPPPAPASTHSLLST